MTTAFYNTQLQAGLGMIDETNALLDLWSAGMEPAALSRAALESGRFPNMSARRLRNVVLECFAPRYLNPDTRPAGLLQSVGRVLNPREYQQLLFLFTCRANLILADFVRDVYWQRYAGGHEMLHSDEAKDFVVRANDEGKTRKQWSESTIRRIAGYLTGCCVDFGLLQRVTRSESRLLPFRIESRVGAILAYELHFAGLGDNRILADPDWQLFGLQREDVLSELRRLSSKGLFILQSAGGVTKISWQCKNREEVVNVLAKG